MHTTDPDRYFDREISWLRFNARVLQEAEDVRVPLFERLKFLAIFSSNLDEFFRVRVAGLRHLLRLKKKKRKQLDFDPAELLRQIHAEVTAQQERYGRLFRTEIVPALADVGIELIDERALTDDEAEALHGYFRREVRPHLMPVPLGRSGEPLFLENQGLYLVVELDEPAGGIRLSARDARYALVEVPSPPLPRFVAVPGPSGPPHRVLFLDDVVRRFLPDLFPNAAVGAAYAVKLSRDADLYLDDAFEGDLKAAIERALAKRPMQRPTRFLYDLHLPGDLLALLRERLGLEEEDLVEGGRYHNLHDFFGFPRFGVEGHEDPALPPLPHPAFEAAETIREAVEARDRLIHTPYQSFRPVVRLLEEAAEDPGVERIAITLYRVADDSAVSHALLRAAEAGKRVTAFVEAKARFDEANNLQWARRMEAAGVQVLYSMRDLKVHTKLAHVARRDGPATAYLGTGNFNEKTAALYSDFGLFTADARLTADVAKLFAFLRGEDPAPRFAQLLVAPFHLREGFYRLIDREIDEARAGRPARILAKMNSLEDGGMIDRLYAAAQAGVEVQLLVRGLCCLRPGVDGLSGTITATSLVDRFLEHARCYVFHHGGDEQVYLASADWMTRNLDRRVEVAFPVFDPALRALLHRVLDLHLRDNVKARILDADQENRYVERAGPPVRAQLETYRMLEALVAEAAPEAE